MRATCDGTMPEAYRHRPVPHPGRKVIIRKPLRAALVAAEPNPPGDDEANEKVHLKNASDQPIALAGWKIGDSTGSAFWALDNQDGRNGQAPPGVTVVIVRRNRPMWLNNNGDSIVLLNPQGQPVDMEAYGPAQSGWGFRFD